MSDELFHAELYFGVPERFNSPNSNPREIFIPAHVCHVQKVGNFRQQFVNFWLFGSAVSLCQNLLKSRMTNLMTFAILDFFEARFYRRNQMHFMYRRLVIFALKFDGFKTAVFSRICRQKIPSKIRAQMRLEFCIKCPPMKFKRK